MPAITENPKSLLTRREAAEVLGCTTGTLAVWSHYKRGPAYHKVGRSVRYRPGSDPLHQAFVANQMLRLLVSPGTREKRPLEPPEKRSTQDYEFFVGLAGHLQVAMGLRNILLPCEAVAELMEIDKGTVSRYRRWAVEDGYLVIIKKHKYRPGGGGKATEFRIDPSIWEGLKNRITTGKPAPDADKMEWDDWGATKEDLEEKYGD